jgi:hypothetical protein
MSPECMCACPRLRASGTISQHSLVYATCTRGKDGNADVGAVVYREWGWRYSEGSW